LLPFLLPNRFGGALVYGRLELAVKKGDGVSLHVRRRARVEIEVIPTLLCPSLLHSIILIWRKNLTKLLSLSGNK